MKTREKRVSYQASNTYSSLNIFTDQTENIWFCCHGIGFLSRYFIRYFKPLAPKENYILAPQAPSKYYQKTDFKYVGASWLTRENTQPETDNVLNYFDAVWQAENFPADKNLILLGFSQGVSVSMRWMAARKINCRLLVIYAGAIPKELTPEDFTFAKETQVKIVYGTKDEYFDAQRVEEETAFAQRLFGKDRVETITFEGKHEMNSKVITRLHA